MTSPGDEDNCIGLQLPTEAEKTPEGGWPIPKLLEESGNSDFFTRHCDNCGQGR